MAGSRTLKLSILAETADLIRGLDTASRETQTFGDKVEAGFKKVGQAAVIAGAAVVALAGKIAIDGIKAAIEDEAAQARLAKTLENVTDATKGQILAVEDYISQASLAKGITDDELRPAFDRIVRSVKDVTKTQELLNLAMDVAAGTGLSLESVANALSKAYDGNLNALRKLGIKTQEIVPDTKAQETATRAVEKAQLAYNQAVEKYYENSPQAEKAALALRQAKEKLGETTGKTTKATMDFDAVLANLSATFQGQADIAANTYQGRLERMKIAVNEAKESIGFALLPMLEKLANWMVTDGTNALNAFIAGLTGKEGLKPKVQETSLKVAEMAKKTEDLEDGAYAAGIAINVMGKRVGELFEILDLALGGEGSGMAGFLKIMRLIEAAVEAVSSSIKFLIGLIPKLGNAFEGGFQKMLEFLTTLRKGFFGDFTAPNVAPQFNKSSLTVPSTSNLGMASGGANYITVNGAIDPEGVARTIVDVLNNSQSRGTLGAGALVF